MERVGSSNNLGSMELSSKCHLISLSFFLALAIRFSLICDALGTLSSAAVPKEGFSVELIHRDSPKSPFYDPTETPFQRLEKTVNRSVARANHLASIINGTDHKAVLVTDDSWLYLLSINLGTPPLEVTGVFDTGSNLVWTQCANCEACFRQTAPIFDPSESKTYENVSCHAKECNLVASGKCDTFHGDLCSYDVHYGTGTSFSYGNLAVDVITMDISGSPVGFRAIIGCGSNNGGRYFGGSISGVIALGPKPISLINQMGDIALGKFAHCLVPFKTIPKKPSILHFGNSAIVSGPGTVSATLAYGYLYWLTLEGITVGPVRIQNSNNESLLSDDENLGNIIIDAGTTISFLEPKFYSDIEDSVKAQIKTLKPVEELPQSNRLCYWTTELNAPLITMHFKGGDVYLETANTFMRIEEDLMCFALRPAQNGGRPIYGSFMQTNFWVEYDLRNMVVSFKPTDCTQV